VGVNLLKGIWDVFIDPPTTCSLCRRTTSVVTKTAGGNICETCQRHNLAQVFEEPVLLHRCCVCNTPTNSGHGVGSRMEYRCKEHSANLLTTTSRPTPNSSHCTVREGVIEHVPVHRSASRLDTRVPLHHRPADRQGGVRDPEHHQVEEVTARRDGRNLRIVNSGMRPLTRGRKQPAPIGSTSQAPRRKGRIKCSRHGVHGGGKWKIVQSF
jgi:hypothetical protein